MLFLQALAVLFVYDIANCSGQFQFIYLLVTHCRVATGAPASDTIERVCRAVNCACIWYPKHALCLQRSCVTTYLLRRRGVSAQMVLGAQKLPFKAHAWVEVDGHAVNERSNVQTTYTVWDRC